MDMDHENSPFADRHSYLVWCAAKYRQGHPIASDVYMTLVNEGYIQPSLSRDTETASKKLLRLEAYE